MEIINNFLITGFGRSGTKFLSTIMNKSNFFDVRHEPRDGIDEIKITKKLINDFNKNNYGEVNSRMRYRFYDVNVSKRGIIFRDTKTIVKSIANRKSEKQTLILIDDLHYWYNKFNEWVDHDNIEYIDFHEMTTNTIYLQNILNKFGIYDVKITDNDIKKKINMNINNKYKKYSDLPPSIKEKYESFDWL